MRTKEELMKEVEAALPDPLMIDSSGGILYLFYSKEEIGIPHDGDLPIGNQLHLYRFRDSFSAITAFANKPCTWSHVAIGENFVELRDNVVKLNAEIMQDFDELFSDMMPLSMRLSNEIRVTDDGDVYDTIYAVPLEQYASCKLYYAQGRLDIVDDNNVVIDSMDIMPFVSKHIE